MKRFPIQLKKLLPVLFLLFQGLTLSAQNTISLAHPEIPGEPNDNSRRLIALYREAFTELGYKLEIKYLPKKRCLFAADSGEVDGIFLSIAGTEDSFPNLTKIELPLVSFVFSAYAVKPGISLEGWESLADSPLLVCHEIGIITVEQNITRFLPNSQIVITEGTEEGLRMLKAGRCDIYIDLEDRVARILDRNSDLMGDIYKAGLIDRKDMYLYLNKKHLEISEELKKLLNGMIDEERRP